MYGNLCKALAETVHEFQRHTQQSKRSVISSSGQQQQLIDTMICERTMQTVVPNESQANGLQTSLKHQLLLQQVNKRWVICLTNGLGEAKWEDLKKVAERFTVHQVNLILIGFAPNNREKQMGQKLVTCIKQLSADLITPVEAILLFDPEPEEVESVMVKRVANFKQPRNAPLIIETFA